MEQMIASEPSAANSKPSAASLAESFRVFARTLATIGESYGVLIRTYHSEELPYFSKLSSIDQETAVTRLSQYVSICQDVVAGGGSLRSSRTFVWRALKEMGLLPDSDLFTRIEEDEIIEIYNLDHIQIFRNLPFFEYCSYTLEDLYARPWHQLFLRDEPGITQKIISIVTESAARVNRKMVVTHLGQQVTREVNSAGLFALDLTVKSLGVLFDSDDRPQAFLAIEKAAFPR